MNAPPGHFEIRHPSSEEFPRFLKTATTAFGVTTHPGEEDIHRPSFDPERFHAAYEGTQMVGTIGALALEVTVPGGRSVPAAGVTWAGVLPTHRRSGVLRGLMEAQMAQAESEGLALAILTASEGGLYGRFGFGPAASGITFAIDRSRAAFAVPAPPPGRIRLMEGAEAAAALAEVYEGARPLRAGMISRPPNLWHEILADPEWEREGATPFFFAVHESRDSGPDGYLLYRVLPRWELHESRYELQVCENVSPDPQVRAALWQYAMQVDLVTKITTPVPFPQDESLRWLFEDPRSLRLTSLADDLWLRILDVPRALEARSYRAQGRLVLEVADEGRGGRAQKFELAAGTAGSTVSLTVRSPDLQLGGAALATVYLGGVSFASLAAAGVVRELRPGSVATGDLLFGTDVAPFCGTHF